MHRHSVGSLIRQVPALSCPAALRRSGPRRSAHHRSQGMRRRRTWRCPPSFSGCRKDKLHRDNFSIDFEWQQLREEDAILSHRLSSFGRFFLRHSMRPMLESAQATLLQLSASTTRAISAYSGFNSTPNTATQLNRHDTGSTRSRERMEASSPGRNMLRSKA